MASKTSKGNLVAYVGNGEIAIGPLESEADLIKYFFTDSDRVIEFFDRTVIPYGGDIDSLVDKAKEVIEREKKEQKWTQQQ